MAEAKPLSLDERWDENDWALRETEERLKELKKEREALKTEQRDAKIACELYDQNYVYGFEVALEKDQATLDAQRKDLEWLQGELKKHEAHHRLFTTAFSRMTGQEIFERWKLNFAYETFSERISDGTLTKTHLVAMREALKKFGFPGGQTLSLTPTNERAMWDEICVAVGIEVPPQADRGEE